MARPVRVGSARKSKSRIAEAARRREELADLKYRNAAVGAAGIDFAGTGRATRKLLTATGIGKSIAGRPLFAGLDVTLTPGGSSACSARTGVARARCCASWRGRLNRMPGQSSGPMGCAW